MRLNSKNENRIGIIHAKSDMLGYTIQVKENSNYVFPTGKNTSPCFLSLKEAKANLKSLGVGKAYMVYDNLYDDIGNVSSGSQDDWVPIDI